MSLHKDFGEAFLEEKTGVLRCERYPTFVWERLFGNTDGER